MSDGWVPPCYPKEEASSEAKRLLWDIGITRLAQPPPPFWQELIEYEEKMKARKKATLVKRASAQFFYSKWRFSLPGLHWNFI